MTPAALARALGAAVAVTVEVEEAAAFTRVRVLGVPVYDTRWKGVQRRQARRAARRAARAAQRKAELQRQTNAYCDQIDAQRKK